jgi:hypothetical protein
MTVDTFVARQRLHFSSGKADVAVFKAYCNFIGATDEIRHMVWHYDMTIHGGACSSPSLYGSAAVLEGSILRQA